MRNLKKLAALVTAAASNLDIFSHFNHSFLTRDEQIHPSRKKHYSTTFYRTIYP